MLPRPGHIAVPEGGKHCQRAVKARGIVDRVGADLDRLTVRLSRDIHQPAHCLEHGVGRRPMRIGPGLPEAGHR